MIQLTFDDDTIWNYLGNTPWTSTAPSSERPGVTYKEEFCVFIDEMHQWFTDRNIEYSFTGATLRTTDILFQKESDAMLFKLTWM
jgi:hypothetical protein